MFTRYGPPAGAHFSARRACPPLSGLMYQLRTGVLLSCPQAERSGNARAVAPNHARAPRNLLDAGVRVACHLTTTGPLPSRHVPSCHDAPGIGRRLAPLSLLRPSLGRGPELGGSRLSRDA